MSTSRYQPRLADGLKVASGVPSRRWRSVFADYLELMKPEISLVVTLSALAGFVLGLPEALYWNLLLYTLAGVFLCSGGVGAVNHYLERDFDARMRRTASRPLPARRIPPKAARRYGIGLLWAGIGLLYVLVNTLTAGLAILTALLYLLAYTPLKRITKHNTLIGTIPRALPALGGWAAATGTLSAGGWLIFAILAAWQMPHFLTLAWIYREDYRRGGYRMLSVVEPDGASTARQTVFFTGLLFFVVLLPTAVGISGWIYLVGMTGLGLWFVWEATLFYRSRSTADAGRVFKVLIYYVPLLVVLILIDQFM